MTNIIETLTTKRNSLTESLSSIVDEKAYDQVQTEIQQLTKTITLESNRERVKTEQEATRKRQEAIRDQKARLKKIATMKEDAISQDNDLFNSFHVVYDAFSRRYDLAMEIAKETEYAQLTARELDLEIPPSETLTICSISNNWWAKNDFLLHLFEQYLLASNQLQNARNNFPRDEVLKKVTIPDRPGLDWFAKGQGQYFPMSELSEEKRSE